MADESNQAATSGRPSAAPFKPRNLVVLSDGTGNSAAKLFRTNVWRIYEALDLHCDDQVALYDDGVGTASFKPIAIMGGAFGYGLKRNVLDLYTFLCRNYKSADGYRCDPDNPSADDPTKHDRIFAFGFSRGAFTARVVSALVASEGLIHRAETDAELNRLAAWAYRSYRESRYRNSLGVWLLRKLRNGFLKLIQRGRQYDRSKNLTVNVDFLGVFDTVAAYGLPVDELTRGWDKWVWPMLPRDNSLHERVRHARHALSIDDERQTFFPLLWDEDSAKEQQNRTTFKHPDGRIKQVWFAGMHSNVGGGYADDALSLGPLCWMAGEAVTHSLRFQKHMCPSGGPVPDAWLERAAPCAPMGDSRHGLGAYYRYHPRPIARLCNSPDGRVKIDRPTIHESVFERIADSRDGYAPVVLPETYEVVRRSGLILSGDETTPHSSSHPNPFEHSTQAASRLHEQQHAWNAVWLRRVVYFLTIGATLLLLALPFIATLKDYLREWNAYAPLGIVIDAAAVFVPAFAEGWLAKYREITFWLLLNLILAALLLRWGSHLKGDVQGRMGKVWKSHGLKAKPMAVAAELTDWIYKLRTSKAYVGWFRFQSVHLWPNVFGFIMVVIIIVVIPVRLAHEVRSRAGWICDDATTTHALDMPFGFYPSEMCHPTGITIEQGRRYTIQLAIPDPKESCGVPTPTGDTRLTRIGPWFDRTIPVESSAGISSTPLMALFVPFRRVWPAGWYVPIAMIGAALPERHYLTGPATTFTATRTGTLSLFVNDAAVPCLSWDCVYQNNHGGPAKVLVTALGAPETATAPSPVVPYSCQEQVDLQER